MTNNDTNLMERLQAAFPPGTVKYKPGPVAGGKAMVIWFLDARSCMQRLDDVFGVGGWQTSYREVQGGVVCRLRVRMPDGAWCEHEDVGGYSEQSDEGDRAKAAYSDSLKRVCVHLGIGRFLYALPAQWVPYDPKSRKFTKAPVLPAPAKAPTPAVAAANRRELAGAA